MTTHRDGAGAVSLLDIDVDGVHPIGSGETSFPRRWPVLRMTDGAVYEAYRARPAAYLPQVVHRRFREGSRIARTVSAHFTDEFSLAITDSVWRVPRFEVVGNDNDWYILSLRLAGDTVETINGRDHRLGAYSCYLIRYGAGMTYVLRSVSDQPLGEVSITFRPGALAARLGLSLDELIRRLHPPHDPWYSDCRLTPEMLAAIRRLRRRSPADPAYRLFAEATALELLAMYLVTIREESLSGRPQISFPDHVSQLHRVRRHLEENYREPVVVDALAALVGLSRKTLTAGFKREFGKTVLEYHHAVRMDVARALLHDGTTSVLGVARRVGYRYPGNFAKAFLKHTGTSPRDYRRGRIPEPGGARIA